MDDEHVAALFGGVKKRLERKNGCGKNGERVGMRANVDAVAEAFLNFGEGIKGRGRGLENDRELVSENSERGYSVPERGRDGYEVGIRYAWENGGRVGGDG